MPIGFLLLAWLANIVSLAVADWIFGTVHIGHWWPLLLFVGLAGLSDGIGGLVVGAKAADLFPANSLGVVMGLVQMGRGLGIMAGPILGGLLFDLHGNYRMAFLLAVALRENDTAKVEQNKQ